jgi:ADP-dependent NAD(P)H-hydrate dehydratase / NAD(P)H-hydrate epimerase
VIPILGQPILTAAEMRAAEEWAIAAGSSVADLMERAGAEVAESVRRLASGAPVLILCGPGNNGGDGYVAARVLVAAGLDVRVAAIGDPKSAAAIAARKGWPGKVEPLASAKPAPIVVDALFGTGLTRPLEDAVAASLARLIGQARLSIAVDLPSGVATDSGEVLGATAVDLTLALGAAKPAHVLEPAASLCGNVRLLDIGVAAQARASTIARPRLAAPGANAHKYSRGMVVVVGGTMPGAAALTTESAMRAGAGYGLLLADETPIGSPHALVRKPWSEDALAEKRIGAVVVGPGLGRDDSATRKLAAAIRSDHPLVIDGDAIHLLAERRFHDRKAATVMTPHAGEFTAAFGDWSGSKIDATCSAAERSGACIVFKGADTVIAAPDGNVIVAPHGPSWLSTAGTGDVLAGAIGAMLASGTMPPIESAAAGVWLHAEAARRLGAAFIADDLMRALSAVRAAL